MTSCFPSRIFVGGLLWIEQVKLFRAELIIALCVAVNKNNKKVMSRRLAHMARGSPARPVFGGVPIDLRHCLPFPTPKHVSISSILGSHPFVLSTPNQDRRFPVHLCFHQRVLHLHPHALSSVNPKSSLQLGSASTPTPFVTLATLLVSIQSS